MSNPQILARRWAEAVASGRDDALEPLLDDAVIDHTPGAPPGRTGFAPRLRMIHSVFAEVAVTVDEVVAAGDRVAWRWTLTGIQRGAFLGVAATGRRVQLRGVNFQRLAGGRVCEHWTQLDLHGVLAQLAA